MSTYGWDFTNRKCLQVKGYYWRNVLFFIGRINYGSESTMFDQLWRKDIIGGILMGHSWSNFVVDSEPYIFVAKVFII